MNEVLEYILPQKECAGIYKITYLPTGESYIGRSTDVSKRWIEHCKSAFNIGSIAHSTLHTRMAEKGIHNFTFELLEEVDKENLNNREKYYINLYGTKDYGMNMQEGG
jgi:group I intron endonuclease